MIDIAEFVSESIRCYSDVGEPYTGTEAQKRGMVDAYADATYDEAGGDVRWGNFDAYVEKCSKDMQYYM